MNADYDLAIIGGGAAGLVAAPFAVQLGARVALVERDRMGGDCTWTGCVPSKTLLKAARVAHEMRGADRYGLGPVEPVVDLDSVMGRVRAVAEEVYQHATPEGLRKLGIDVFPGEARFLDHQTVTAGGTTLSARHFLISTGAHPFTPPIAGLEDVDYLTYENIWDLKVLPRRFTVIGAGPIGCEMAQAFHRLGAEVTLMEAAERLLPQDDVDASRALAEAFTSEGIDLRLGVSAQRVWQDGEGIHLVAGDSETVCDGLLVAVGRRPNVHGLDLEKAGVDHSERGIGVDRHLRTSRKHIYAAGDCTGGYQFTHYAGWQGFIAVRNALLPGAFRGVSEHVPWTTFTGPEVAHVGLTESQARERLGGEVMARQWPMDRVDRAQCEGETGGFLKLVYRKNGHLLGVTIVAAQAGEMINEWVVAMERGLKVDELAGAIHVYPTYATASMTGSAAVKVERLMGGLSGRIIRRLARVRR